MAEIIGVRPRAVHDIVELAVYIGKDSVLAADKFLDACQSTFTCLATTPRIGGTYATLNPRLSGMRVFRIQGFPNHLAFYLERELGIEVVRVLHGARDLDAALRDD